MAELTVNGKRMQFEAEAETPLLWVLRDVLDLKGTKYGCGEGLCGACTVHLDGKAVRPLSRYFGGFNVVVFTPEDLALPRGSPGDRRRFLDRGVFNLVPLIHPPFPPSSPPSPRPRRVAPRSALDITA